MKNKERQYQRLTMNQVTELRPCASQEDLRNPDAKVQNVSLGGAYIETETLFPIGTVVEFSLKLPNHPEHIPVKAKVRHLKTKPSPGLGVKFLDIQDKHLEALKAYLEAYGRRGEG